MPLLAIELIKGGDGSSARETAKREMENYIHADEISALIRKTNPEGPRPDTIKKRINNIGAAKMTIDLLHSRDPDDEILSWLREISAFVNA